MKRKTPGVTAKKPKSPLFKPVKVAWRDFFKGLGKIAGSGVVQRPDGAISGLVDSLCSISLTTEPGELAYRLVLRSLARAVVDLVEEARTRFEGAENHAPDTLSELLEEQLAELEFDIDQNFLDHPETFSGLKTIQAPLIVWLKWRGLGTLEAEAVARRLPSFFVYALQEEWRSDLTGYRELANALDTKFTKAAERDWSWQRYAALLQRRTEESVFDESFGLRDIYIPLRAYYLAERKNNSAGGAERLKVMLALPQRVVVDARAELDRWLSKRDPADALRVISGGPGSGKSSFARICAADWAKEGRRVLFIPLHLIDPSRDIVQQVSTCIEGELGYNPLDIKSAEPDLLVIFDGLDELSHQGKAAAETARSFVREIEKLLQLRNFHEFRLRVILSGREVVVQESESELRREGEVLTLLPYYVQLSEHDLGWHDPSGLLQEDQRQRWWKQFGALIGKSWDALPSDLNRYDLTDVTAQPLLNYLVAQSYVRGTLDFRSNINLNQIYEDLAKAVHNRGYERSRRHASIPDLRLEDFFRVLEEVALATWHGDSRSATVREIMLHCQRSGMGGLLEKFTQGAEAGVTNLLAAFFFRRQGQRETGDRTFVFTHKSFGEYLTARRFVRAVDEVSDERERRRTRGYGGWDENDALSKWAQICGPSAVTRELLSFIRAEIALRHVDYVNSWQEEFAALFRYMLGAGFPREAVNCGTFRDSCVWARNASEALLVAVNACAIKTRSLPQIDPGGTRAELGTWLRHIQPQRDSPVSTTALYCLSYLNLEHQYFYGSDLYRADFEGSNLSNTQFGWAWLHQANFTGAKLAGAFFREATARDASFVSADLTSTVFDGAVLEGANFEKAILTGSSFETPRRPPKGLKEQWEHQNSGWEFGRALPDEVRVSRGATTD